MSEQSVKVPKLGAGRQFQPADFTINRYIADVPVGTTLADVLTPDYFANHLDKLRRGMEITVLSEDMSLDARIRCLSVSATTAKFRILDVYAGELPDAKPKLPEQNVEVSWGGPQQKWRVIHNGQIVSKDLSSREEAEAARDDYLKTVNEG